MSRYAVYGIMGVCITMLAVSIVICAGVLYQTAVLAPQQPQPSQPYAMQTSESADLHYNEVRALMSHGRGQVYYQPNPYASGYGNTAAAPQTQQQAAQVSYANAPRREQARAYAGGYAVSQDFNQQQPTYSSRVHEGEQYQRNMVRTAVRQPGMDVPRRQPGMPYRQTPPAIPVAPEYNENPAKTSAWNRNTNNTQYAQNSSEFTTPEITDQTGPAYLQVGSADASGGAAKKPQDDAAKAQAPAAAKTSLPNPGKGKIPIYAGFGYGRVKDAPVDGQLPVRMSTEAVISNQTIGDYLPPTQVKKLQPRPDPDGGILEPTANGWRVSATGIEWMRTDYGVNSGEESGRNDKISSSLKVSKIGDRVDLNFHVPFEYNRTSGALTPYTFARLGLIGGPKFKITRESNGQFLDVDAGAYLFAMRNFAIGESMKDSSQYGPSFIVSAKKSFKPVDLGFAVSYTHTLDQEDGTGPLEGGLQFFKLKLTAGVPLGEKWVLNNHFELNTAPNSTDSGRTWIDFGTDATYMMSETMFLHFIAGADTDVEKTWHLKFGLDYVLKF